MFCVQILVSKAKFTKYSFGNTGPKTVLTAIMAYCIYTLPHGIQSFGEKKVLMAFLSVGNVQKKVKYIEHQIVENHGLDGIEIFSLIILKLCFLKRL